MVSSLENTLTDQRKTSDEIQDSLQLQLKDRDEASAKMSDRFKNLENQKTKLIDEKVRGDWIVKELNWCIMLKVSRNLGEEVSGGAVDEKVGACYL